MSAVQVRIQNNGAVIETRPHESKRGRTYKRRRIKRVKH